MGSSVACDNTTMSRSMLKYFGVQTGDLAHSLRNPRQYFQRQMAKSLKISGTAEKERNRFFNKMYSKIEDVRTKIQKS